MEENQSPIKQSVEVINQIPESKSSTSKKITAFLLVITALTVFAGVYLFFNGKNESGSMITEVENSNLIISNYGFSFTIPDGWYIWEGQSASGELIASTDFISVMTDIMIAGDAGKAINIENTKRIQVYQDFMNNWNVGSSTVIVLTNANFDYKDRNLANAGKIRSTLIDSTDILEQGATEIAISNYDFKEETINRINVNGIESPFELDKRYKLVDVLMISLPISSNKYIEGEKVKSLMFTKYIRKGDTTALQELVSFISKLNISKYP